MASFLNIYHHRNDISDKFFDLLERAEVNREKEFLAAVKIQSAFHRYIFRQILAERNRNAIIIQRNYRMYRAQLLLRCLIIEREKNLRSQYFNQMALKIQNTWRKYIISHNIQIDQKPKEPQKPIKIRKVIKKRKSKQIPFNNFNEYQFANFGSGCKLQRAPK